MCRMEKFPGHGLCPDFSGPGRPARSMHIPVPVPVPVPNFHLSPFPIWKSLIGRFSNRKWRPWGRSWWKWLFYLRKNALRPVEHPHVFHFSIGEVIIRWFWNRKWAKRRKNANISGDPILSTRRIPRGRDRILSTQRIPRGRDPILSTQSLYIFKLV